MFEYSVLLAGGSVKERENAVLYTKNKLKGVTDVLYEHSENGTLIFNDIKSKNDIDAVFIRNTETADGKKNVSKWVGHNHLRALDKYDDKTYGFYREFTAFIGYPKELEIERKFLIEYPDTEMLEKMHNCKKTYIEQMYLSRENGVSARIRKRTLEGKTVYYYTEKVKISAAVREEHEFEISEEEYERYAKNADKERVAVVKNRYCIMENGTYFEVDVFPFWKDKAFLEVELISEDEHFVLPVYVKVIREVTEEKGFTNRAIAKMLKDGLV